MTISLQNETFKKLMQEAKQGNKTSYDEACKIIAFHIKPYIENKYKTVDFDVLYAIIDNVFKYRIEVKGYDQDILAYSRYVLKTTYVKIEQNKLATEDIEERVRRIKKETGNEDIDKQTLINDLINRIETKRDPSLTDKQVAYINTLKLLKDGSSYEKFATKMYQITYEVINDYIQKQHKYKELDQCDIQDIINDVIMNKITDWYKEKKFPEYFYYWIQIVKRSVNIFLGNKLKEKLNEQDSNTIILYEEESADILEEIALDNELKEMLRKYIAELTPRDQQIMSYRFYHNLTYREIAEKINISKQYVEQREKKAIKQLYNKLKRYQNCRCIESL